MVGRMLILIKTLQSKMRIEILGVINIKWKNTEKLLKQTKNK